MSKRNVHSNAACFKPYIVSDFRDERVVGVHVLGDEDIVSLEVKIVRDGYEVIISLIFRTF